MCCGEQMLLFGSDNRAGQDANSVGDLQLCSKLYKLGLNFSSSVPTMASTPAGVQANARSSRSRPFFQLSLPKNSTSGCSDIIVSTSEAIAPFWDKGSSIALGMTANLGSRQPQRSSSAPSSAEVK